MKRRDFIKAGSALGVLPVFIGGYGVAKSSPIIDTFARLAQNDDRVLVLIQLSGGNDGLNTIIPLDQYTGLMAVRGNIAIPENQVLKLTDKTGIHPAMKDIANLYSDGKIAVVQNVGYPTPNLSHFRATDIWTSASDYNKVVNSGWLGRYLANQYQDFPDNYPNATMPDPLSITLSAVTSTTCQGPIYSMGIAVQNSKNFYDLVSAGTDVAPDSAAGVQLTFLREQIGLTQKYTEALKAAAAKGKNLSTKYAAEADKKSLSDQLKIVAQLISGGLKTKIYVCSLGGFDTHSNQIDDEGNTAGSHATLLGDVSQAIGAFMDDMKLLGLSDRVAGMTFSEFGRRIVSNLSLGTDHGAAAPLIAFGANVNPKIHGTNPKIDTKATEKDNLPMEIDFRSVYASALRGWLGVDSATVKQILFADFPEVQVFKSSASSVENQDFAKNSIEVYPNPSSNYAKLKVKSEGEFFNVSIFNTAGYQVSQVLDRKLEAGDLEINLDLSQLQSGKYFVRVSNGKINSLEPLMIVR
jgi:uncharacterized protein (DUF1501 family)